MSSFLTRPTTSTFFLGDLRNGGMKGLYSLPLLQTLSSAERHTLFFLLKTDSLELIIFP